MYLVFIVNESETIINLRSLCQRHVLLSTLVPMFCSLVEEQMEPQSEGYVSYLRRLLGTCSQRSSTFGDVYLAWERRSGNSLVIDFTFRIFCDSRLDSTNAQKKKKMTTTHAWSAEPETNMCDELACTVIQFFVSSSFYVKLFVLQHQDGVVYGITKKKEKRKKKPATVSAS